MPERINILHITTNLSSHNGIEETIRILCHGLDPDLFKIGLCSIADGPEEILKEFRDLNIEIYCINRKGYFIDPFTTIRIIKTIKKFKAHIVHTHRNKANLHGRIAGFLTAGTFIVTTHHDMEDIVFSRTAALKKRSHFVSLDVFDDYPDIVESTFYPFLNILLNLLNSKVIAVSNNVRSIYTSNPDDTRIETVYAPFDETAFKYNYEGFVVEKITLGTVGRLATPKGHICLLQAMKKLIGYRSDVHLKIIGDGPLRAEMKLFIKENKLEDNVTLCGNMTHNVNLYDGIDIYIQPSISEGCSITMLEAMGVGIPVIASDIDGPKELIIHNRTGILVPPKNPDALTEAILDLIENKDKAIKLGKAGNRRAREKYSSKIFIEKMSRIYQDLASGI